MIIYQTTMTNNEGLVHLADVVEDEEIPASSAGRDDVAKRQLKGKGIDRRLSFVSRQYDVDGDGQLDEAELASESV
jgi:hypothetical protein